MHLSDAEAGASPFRKKNKEVDVDDLALAVAMS
jgi:hypothetical protein